MSETYYSALCSYLQRCLGIVVPPGGLGPLSLTQWKRWRAEVSRRKGQGLSMCGRDPWEQQAPTVQARSQTGVKGCGQTWDVTTLPSAYKVMTLTLKDEGMYSNEDRPTFLLEDMSTFNSIYLIAQCEL